MNGKIQRELKMEAEKNQADIAGINLEHALEAYEWTTLRPITDDGVTVAGFWKCASPVPEGYIVDGSGKYLRRDSRR